MSLHKISPLLFTSSAPVTVALEVEPELKDAVGKLAAEAMPVRVFPLSVDNLEGDVFVRRSSVEAQGGEVLIVRASFQKVFWGGTFVDQVRVEDIKLVTLHNLGRRVVEIVVGLVVLVPLKSGVHSVEETWFAGTVFVSPQVGLAGQGHFHAELGLISSHPFFSAAEKNILGTLAGITCRRRTLGWHVLWCTIGHSMPDCLFYLYNFLAPVAGEKEKAQIHLETLSLWDSTAVSCHPNYIPPVK